MSQESMSLQKRMLQSIAEALRHQLQTEYFKNFEIDVLSPISVKIGRIALKPTSL
jgi:hypothetical protein